MKFVLQLWPDDEAGATPQQLLQFAIDSIRRSPELAWDILDDNDTLVHANVSLEAAPLGQALDRAIKGRNDNAEAVHTLAVKALALSLTERLPQIRYLELTEGDQGAHDVTFQGLLDADGNDVDVEELNEQEDDYVRQLEDWRLTEMAGPEEAPTFVTIDYNARTPIWRIDLQQAAQIETAV